MSDPQAGTSAMPQLGGLFVSVACKLFARTGEWPGWFLRVVGEPVPAGYLGTATRWRTVFEQTFGMPLPARVAQRRSPRLETEQLELPTGGAERPRAKAPRPREPRARASASARGTPVTRRRAPPP
jgi:hypothetical protein